MTENRLLDLVDTRDFRTLFIDELGWDNPDQPNLVLVVDDDTFTLTQVAGYKGMRIWHCPVLPPRKTQRLIDVLVGKDNHERLVIFNNQHKQEWRWPRRAQLGSANAKLLVHEHIVGDRTTHLAQRLEAIRLDFDDDITLVALLDKMRDAFDHEAETASVAAARLMGTLYTELETTGVDEQDATLLLARLLFLLFGDDAEMWKPEGLFERYLREHTTAQSLHKDLQHLFAVLDTDEKRRDLPADSPYTPFRYINGGLFHDTLRLPALTSAFRDALVDACKFDWSIISPAVFGSMFQTVKSKEARRHGGEHYTSEENILKTIRPLFLDEYRDRLERAWDDKAQLTKLHNELGRLRFLDPACGCGNFLIVAYRELRALELEILRRRRDLDMPDVASKHIERAQLSLDISGDIKVTLDHFYGIEIDEWPARIAETAMLLVDHLANQQMSVEFGVAPDRLPIAIAPTIVHKNALHIDWALVVPPDDNVVILGNPPFSGRGDRSPVQTADQKLVWGTRYNINLDYVTCWFLKAIEYYEDRNGRWAFVSTNSTCQGEPTADLWKPILDAGWRCRFAHRSFSWQSEARGKAVVHVSIVGFDRGKITPKPTLWTYPDGGKGTATVGTVRNINPYLIDFPNILVVKRSKPLSPSLPEASFGSMPNDGRGNLLVSVDEYDTVAADPIARKYLRRFIGAKELLHDRMRWCLWLTELDPEDLGRSLLLHDRIEAVRMARASSDSPTTSTRNHPPHLFGQIAQPRTSYLAIPRHVSELRRFFTVARYDSDVICGDANFLIPDPDGFALAILSSSMFMVWQKAIGGRIKSDLRFSKTFTYNTFPLPHATDRQRLMITDAAAGIITARESHPGTSLAKLYDPLVMPDDLLKAHSVLDSAVDELFGNGNMTTESSRQEILFRSYVALTGQDTLL
ncbi:DNA methyltransferase [Nocardia sp. NPDC050793]|uniref:class I SAM-dependent DNA methyltransferase n=1 Tax=Nocardia sp. NPDC050793 TaxID=3155159 RepID=UPI00340900A1